MDTDLYVPMNKLILEKEKEWTFTSINLSYLEISKRKIVIWCEENLKGRWTMISGKEWGFEDPHDAIIFKIKFGLSAEC